MQRFLIREESFTSLYLTRSSNPHIGSAQSISRSAKLASSQLRSSVSSSCAQRGLGIRLGIRIEVSMDRGPSRPPAQRGSGTQGRAVRIRVRVRARVRVRLER